MGAFGGSGAFGSGNIQTLLDQVSNVNGAIITRQGGSWAAAVNLALSSTGVLQLATQATPAAPASGVNVYASALRGRNQLVVQGPSGDPMPMQPSLATRHVAQWVPNAGTSTMTNIGFENIRFLGTATTRGKTTTNMATASCRTGAVSAAGAGSVCGFREAPTNGHAWLGNAAGLGGFYYVARFVVSDASLVATANMFVGLQASTAAPTDVAPSTLTNLIGVGCNNGDTHLQLYAAGGSAQARVDLGANFPVNTVSTDVYELVLWAPPNASSVFYRVTRLNTGDTVTGSVTGANIPSNTTFITPNYYRSNGGTATAVALDLLSTYLETDN